MNGLRRLLPILAFLLLCGCGPSQGPVAIAAEPTPLPTLAVAVEILPPTPTVTPTGVLTLTIVPSVTPSVTASRTPSPTPPPTPTLIPTATPFPRPTPWPTPSGPLTTDERLLLMDETWRTISERYLDPGFNGVDWVSLYTPTRERVLAAADNEGVYEALRQMVARLSDRHSRFMSPDEAVRHFELSRNEVTYGGFGMYSLTLQDSALVLQVQPDSPAAAAGLRACDRILSLDGGYYRDAGEVGSGGRLVVARPGSDSFGVTLQRAEVTQVLDVPAMLLDHPTKRLAYARVDTLWTVELAGRLGERLGELSAEAPLDGLVLDLRPNLGGWRRTLQGILGLFVSGELGTFSGRLRSDVLVAPRDGEPDPPYPDLPLVILVGEHTESYAEVLAATLQAERGALVLGRPTQGNVETIFPHRLPYGAVVWVAEQGFELNSGLRLEGRGVQPDQIDNRDWTQFPCGRDPQIAAATTLLAEMSAP